MKRNSLNFVIDAVAFAAFAFLSTTGVLLHYLLPAGSGRWQSIWGLTRHQWGELHFWVAVVMFAVLAVHLFLHWRWIVCTAKGRDTDRSGARLGLGIVGALAVLALASAPLFTPVERSGNPPPQYGRHLHQPSD